MLCSEHIVVNSGGSERAASLLRCKRWSCELCSPRNRWEVIKAACRGKPDTLITLTIRPQDWADPSDAGRAMVKGLKALRKAMQRERNYPHTPMICVFERHKSGWPHLHILARSRWIDQAWLSRTWKRLTGAWCVDIRRIQDAGRAAYYLAKYLGKDLAHFEGCKRWWRTRDYELEPRESMTAIGFGDRWTKYPGLTWDRLLKTLETQAVEIVSHRPGWIHWREAPP